jgi:NADPH:quinone reductase-like Zn-dependent oxidoreductase
MDICGVIEQIGSGVVGFNVGDKVFGFGPGLSEYTLTSPEVIALLPKEVPADVAGGLGVAPNTAYQMLADNGAFEGTEPKQIVVIGAAGGCGTCAVQIARAKCPKGTKIYAVCSGKNADFVKSLGADEVLDYTKSGFDFRTCLPAKSVDIVADCVSSKEDHNYVPEGMGLLKEETGRYVAINSASTLDWIKVFISKMFGFNLFKKQYSLMYLIPRKEELIDIGNMVKDGKLKIHVDSYVPFDEQSIRSAFETLKSRRVKGKLIVKVSS